MFKIKRYSCFHDFSTYRVLQSISSTEYYRVLQSITEYDRVLQSFTEYYTVLQSIAECYRVLHSITEYCTVLQSITEYPRVLESITEYYKDKSTASTWTNFWLVFVGGGIFSFGGYIICFWGNVLIGGKDLLGLSLSLYGFYYWGKIINFWGSDY